MKKISKLFLLAFFAVGLVGLINGQSESDPEYGVAYSSYNKAKNETTLEVRQLEIVKAKGQWIILNASTSFSGQKLVNRPDIVLFIVQIGSDDGYKYPDTMQMKLKVDGKNVADVLMLNLDKRQADKMYLETIGTRMKYDVFKTISQAKSVEIQLDKTIFTLNAAHLAKLADLDKLMTP